MAAERKRARSSPVQAEDGRAEAGSPDAGSPTARAAAAARLAVVVGEEELLVERAVAGAVSLAAAAPAAGDGVGMERATGSESGGGLAGLAGLEGAAGAGGRSADGVGADVHDVSAASLTPGQLTTLASPSLFGGGSVLVVRAAQDASKDVAAELTSLARSAAPDVYLVVTHAGGAKNKALLADLLDAGARRIDCPSVKRFGERMDFLRAEFRRAGRRADDSGLRALLDAVGNDLRELAAACSQLSADTTGVIGQQTVSRYYRGRAEATGFSVADRACEGNLPAALEQLRWALATGTSPVLVSSALAQGLRTLGLVGSTGRGLSANAAAAELGMPPWKIDRARQQLRGWTAEGLAVAHAAVAEADVQVKGEAVSAGYALERAIATIVACRTAS